MAENYRKVGVVTHFFDQISVAVVLLDDALYLEDWVLFFGPRTEVEQQVFSMQVNHQPIDKGDPGDEVAIKVDEPVREGDNVYLLSDTPQELD